MSTHAELLPFPHNLKSQLVFTQPGSEAEVPLGWIDRLLSGVKETVSTCNFILGESLQRANSGRSRNSIIQ